MKAVHRVFQVLDVLAASNEPLDVLEVTRRTGIARNSTQRLLESLVQSGYVLEPVPGTYAAGLRTWGLAAALTTVARIRQAAFPNMVGLATALMTTVTLAFLEEDEVVYTDRIDVVGDRVVPVMLNVRAHPLVTSSGRALVCERTDEAIGLLLTTVPKLTPQTVQDPATLLETLRECRGRGYAVAERQLQNGVSGVAVAVRDETGCPWRPLASTSGVNSPRTCSSDCCRRSSAAVSGRPRRSAREATRHRRFPEAIPGSCSPRSYALRVARDRSGTAESEQKRTCQRETFQIWKNRLARQPFSY